MRVPIQGPAVVRNRRSRPVRRFDRSRAEADGVRLSQYDGDDEGDAGEEDDDGQYGGEDGGDDVAEQGGDDGDASVESE